MNNIITFAPKGKSRPERRRSKNGAPEERDARDSRPPKPTKNMRTISFRSRESILEADEGELFEDACCELDRALERFRAAQVRLERTLKYSADETIIVAKLGAAVVAAMLHTHPLRPTATAVERPVLHDLAEK